MKIGLINRDTQGDGRPLGYYLSGFREDCRKEVLLRDGCSEVSLDELRHACPCKSCWK